MDAKTIEELKSTSWIHASAEIAGIESKVRGRVKPEMDEDAVRGLYEAELVPYILNHMTRTEAVCALVTAKGIIPEIAIASLMQALRGFCRSAAAGKRAFCPKKPCEWKGEVSEVGPVGKCPLCFHLPVTILNLDVPPASNGRLKLVT